MAIRGILVDGVWVIDPTLVKKEFHDFFHSKFQHFHGVNLGTPSSRFRKLSDDQVNDLHSNFSE